MVRRWAPDRGDVVWLNFDPQAGHEQAKTRPALVLSPRSYNVATAMLVCCPITSTSKGYPFESSLSGTTTVQGFVLTDQLKSFDWKARKAKAADRCDEATLADVGAKIRSLLCL